MKSFQYTITAQEGLHARPAKTLVQEASRLNSVVMLDKGGQKGNARKIFAVMALGVKQGDQVTVTVEGESEEADCAAIREVFEKYL